MDLDELQTVKDTERGKDSLQHLSDSFYADVAEHIAALKDERTERAAAADDPFDDPQIQRLTSEIDSTEQVVNSIYERRVGKLVKLASFAAADMPADEEGLTSEERELFSDLVSRIKDNRAHVLDVLAGEHAADSATDSADASDASEASPSPQPEPKGMDSSDAADVTESSDEPAVSAADLMGDGTETATDLPSTAGAATDEPTPRPDSDSPELPGDGSTESPGSEPGREPTNGPDDVDRTTLRITRDVGEIVGVDDREYELASDDVVSLPEANAGALVAREAAERLD